MKFNQISIPFLSLISTALFVKADEFVGEKKDKGYCCVIINNIYLFLRRIFKTIVFLIYIKFLMYNYLYIFNFNLFYILISIILYIIILFIFNNELMN